MSDFFDEDVTKATSEEIGVLIKLRLRRFQSVQVFKRGRKIILRTWRVDFEVEDAIGDSI